MEDNERLIIYRLTKVDEGGKEKEMKKKNSKNHDEYTLS